MKLNPGEVAILFIRRSDTEPTTYFFAVRKSGSFFDTRTNDLHLHGGQEVVLNLGEGTEFTGTDFTAALDKAVTELKNIQQ